MAVDNGVVVFTESKVRALADVTQSQLRYWARDLVPPAVDRQITEHRGVRLYDFDGVLTVMVLAELKRRNKSLQHLRQIVYYIKQEGLKLPELKFATSGSRVHFQRPDGSWQDADRPQSIDEEVVPLDVLRAKVQQSLTRDRKSVGRFEKRRGTLGSKEVVAGTRVPVATVRRYLDRGVPETEVLEAFPTLNRQDVEAARASA